MKLDNYVDIKVFILYLMKNVGEPLEFTTVNDIVLQDEFVGYFDFAFCFSDLLDAGAIVSEESGGKTLYSVSALGLETLESYEGSLLPVIKERALRSALRLIAFNRSGSRITTDINEVAGGVYARLSDRGQGTNAVFHRNLHCRTRHCRKIPRQFRGTCGGHLPRGAFAAFRGCELSFR